MPVHDVLQSARVYPRSLPGMAPPHLLLARVYHSHYNPIRYASVARVNSIIIMPENETIVKVGIVPAKDGLIKKDVSAAKGAEASVDESTPKNDPAAEEAPAAGTVNSVMENIVDYKVKVGFGGRVKAVLSFASESPSLLGAEVPLSVCSSYLCDLPASTLPYVPRPQACGAKNALAKDVPAKSGAEGSDECILKKDLAAAEAPDDQADDTVDSDLAKAVFAAHEPSPDAVFWSKLARPSDPPTAPTGAIEGEIKKDISAAKSGAEASFDETCVIKNDPALKPVTKVATALKPAAPGGAPLSTTNEFPEETPAPVSSALHSAPCVYGPTL